MFTQQRYAEALPLLEEASQAGDSQAQNLLGVMYMNGIGMELDPHRAFALFHAAADSGLKEGHYNLSNLQFHGAGVPRDERAARGHLLTAAQAGHRPALRALGFMYHLMGAGDWPRLSTAAFEHAALMGDPLSKYYLGLRLWHGHGIEPDPVRASGWLAAAARDGVTLAMRRLQELESLHPGTPASLPAASTPKLGMTWPEWEHRPLHKPEPDKQLGFLSEYRGTLDDYLCDHLINIGAPSLAPSAVLDPEGGYAKSVVRTSYNMFLRLSTYDAITAAIWGRFSVLAGLPPEHAEPLVVQRYQVGQEYKQHRDYFTAGRHTSQRMVTVFAYLSDVEAGGETDFPILGVSVKPERGKAVRFNNVQPDGRPDPDTLHAGLPVLRGEKWLATLWFWDRPFDWFR